MAWQNTIANKVTMIYLNLKCNMSIEDLQKDPQIKDLPFFNQDASGGMNDNDIKLFAGEFTTYLIKMKFTPEDGKDEDAAYDDILAVCSDGGKNASDIGEAVNDNYKFIDEESAP